MNNFKGGLNDLAEVLVIEDLETLKVISDPLRLQILELMVLEPKTVKEVADQLQVSPNKLYYHINLLEKHGLIRVVGTQLVSGIVEKHYRVKAKDIRVADGLISVSEPGGEDQVQALMTTVLESTKEEFTRMLRHGSKEIGPSSGKTSLIVKEMARMTAEQAKAFGQRLSDLIDEFAHTDLDEPQAHTYAVMALLYPTYRGKVGLDDG